MWRVSQFPSQQQNLCVCHIKASWLCGIPLDLCFVDFCQSDWLGCPQWLGTLQYLCSFPFEVWSSRKWCIFYCWNWESFLLRRFETSWCHQVNILSCGSNVACYYLKWLLWHNAHSFTYYLINNVGSMQCILWKPVSGMNLKIKRHLWLFIS